MAQKRLFRISSIVLALMLGLLAVAAACSQPAATPTTKPSPSPTQAPSPSPTASPKPTAAPSPTPTAKPAAVKLRYRHYPVSSANYAVGVAIRQAVIADFPELEVTLSSVDTTAARIEEARRGEVDMFATTSDVSTSAYLGTGDYKGRAVTDIRSLYFPLVSAITFFALKDSGVTTLYELAGKPYGVVAGSAIQSLANIITKTLGIAPKWDAAGGTAIVEAVQARRTIGFVRVGMPDVGIVEIAASKPVTILGFTKEDVAKVDAASPGTFITVTIPAKTYPGQDQDLLTLGYAAGEAADKDVPEDVVYKWVKAVYNHRADIAKSAGASSKGYSNMVENTLKATGIPPLHPGAVKFYKELGLTIPASLMPPK